MKRLFLSGLLLATAIATQAYTRQDTLRGSNGIGRSWWDVQHYSLNISFDTARKSIRGTNVVTFSVISTPHDSLQIDLQDGMFLDEIQWKGQSLDFVKEGNVFWVRAPFKKQPVNSRDTLMLRYHGRPAIAKNPPWNGGFVWSKDSLGRPWIAVACQGYGASSWWPCKDDQADEPDLGMDLTLNYSFDYSLDVANGRSRFINDTVDIEDPVTGQITRNIYRSNHWQVRNPINTYDVTFYLGNYAHWQDTIMGEKGRLDLDFYPLDYNLERSRQHFHIAKQMLHCFEYWMGPYPFYEDGYKLVEAPYLGMEHQSAVAYGNQYRMGYLGQDRSKTGIGQLFDFIIIHESGHEWFGNSITAKDIADNWLHEGFTTYTEGLFAECATSRDSAFRYIQGEWDNIRNDRPVIGDYGVNNEGSADMYDKGSAVVHMIRNMMQNDERFRQLLRGLNRDFYHRVVTSSAVEAYISSSVGKNLQPFFDQYLRTAGIPSLEYYVKGKRLHYRFSNVTPGFSLPVAVFINGKKIPLEITGDWQEIKVRANPDDVIFSPEFLYRLRYMLEP